MAFTFENHGTNTYLVYEIQDGDELDSMSLGMLTNNRIPGFAAATFMQMDSTKYIKYNVSAKISVSNLFSGPVNKKRLVGVFSGIVDAMLSAEDYMLDHQSILFDLDYIYADVTTCETVLICLPVVQTEKTPVDLGIFFKNIIFRTQFDQTENCDHVAQIINYLNSTPVLSLEDFRDLLDGLKNPAPQPVMQKQAVQQPAPQPVVPASAPSAQVQPKQQRAENVSMPKYTQQSSPQASIPPQNVAVAGDGVNAVARQVQTPPPANRQNVPIQQNQGTSGEKPISMFYLLQHYNKENAAKYKAQQAAKKAQKGSADSKTKKSTPQTAKTNAGFAVPAQGSRQSGFEVPGRSAQAPVPQSAPQNPAPTPVYQPSVPQPQQYQQPITTAASAGAQQSAMPLNFGETTVLGGAIGETTVLGVAVESAKANPHLVRSKNNEKIPLNKPVFRIGKERSYVDYFIGDNTAISRSHANLVDHNGVFHVVDTNSTNHTYVNGAMIQSGVEIKLSHGDKVRLANEDFEFRMY